MLKKHIFDHFGVPYIIFLKLSGNVIMCFFINNVLKKFKFEFWCLPGIGFELELLDSGST